MPSSLAKAVKPEKKSDVAKQLKAQFGLVCVSNFYFFLNVVYII